MQLITPEINLPDPALREPGQEFTDHERQLIRKQVDTEQIKEAILPLAHEVQTTLTGVHWMIGRELFLFDAAGVWADFDAGSLSEWLTEYGDEFGLSKSQLLKFRRVYDCYHYRLRDMPNNVRKLVSNIRNIDRLDLLTPFIVMENAYEWLIAADTLSMHDLRFRAKNAVALKKSGVPYTEILPDMCEAEIFVHESGIELHGVMLKDIDLLSLTGHMSPSSAVKIVSRWTYNKVEITINE